MTSKVKDYITSGLKALATGILLAIIGGVPFSLFGKLYYGTTKEALRLGRAGMLLIGAVSLFIYSILLVRKTGGRGILKDQYPTEEEKKKRDLKKKTTFGQIKEKVKEFFLPLKFHNAVLIFSFAILIVGTVVDFIYLSV